MRPYPGIAYFKLAKPVPGHEVGSVVTITDDALTVGGWIGNGTSGAVNFHVDMAKECPDWFTPVTNEEHRENCKENTIRYIMERRKCTREEAEAFEEKMFEDE